MTHGIAPTIHPLATGLPSIWSLTFAATIAGFHEAYNLQKVDESGKPAEPGEPEDGLLYRIPRPTELPGNDTDILASCELSRIVLSYLAGTIGADNKTVNKGCMPVSFVRTHVQGSACVDMNTHRPVWKKPGSEYSIPPTACALPAQDSIFPCAMSHDSVYLYQLLGCLQVTKHS